MVKVLLFWYINKKTEKFTFSFFFSFVVVIERGKINILIMYNYMKLNSIIISNIIINKNQKFCLISYANLIKRGKAKNFKTHKRFIIKSDNID